MLFHARSICVVGLLAIATQLLSPKIGGEDSRRLDGFEVHQAYAIPVQFERAQLDLRTKPGDRYLLIVGSLGDATQPYRVEVTSEAANKTALTAAQRIEALRCIDQAQSRIAHSKSRAMSPGRNVTPTRAREFHVHVTDGPLDDDRQYTTVNSVPVAVGLRVCVYADVQVANDNDVLELAEFTLERLEKEIMPYHDVNLGRVTDVDGDGRLSVLLSPWLSRLRGGKTRLNGFVRASDFETEIEAPFSNRCDMLYLNSEQRPGEALRGILAHEYTHAVAVSARKRQRLTAEEDWLNEAIAHVIENRFDASWNNLDHRISRFLNSPQSYPLVVPSYYAAGRWRDHGCRGATFLFLQWCTQKFGDGLCGRLVHGNRPGTQNLADATGVEFRELFRHWTLDMARSTRNAGEYSDPASGLRLCGHLSGWGLAGPATENTTIEAASISLELSGTSAAFFELEAKSAGHRAIHLRADYGTQLQVSLVRLPQRTGNQLDVEATLSGDSASTLNLKISGNDDAEIQFVAIESHEGNKQRSHYLSRSRLDAFATEPSFAAESPFGDQKRFRIPVQNMGSELVIKCVLRTAEGEVSVGRTSVSLPDQHPQVAWSLEADSRQMWK